ncbi:MAG: FGGY-family carbohydrate kinase [bacterium]
MAAEKYILAIDHGTSGCKTALVSMTGRVVGFEVEATPIHFLEGGGAEQDPEDWWRALVVSARRLVDQRLVALEDIAAVCCSSTFSTTVAVGDGGRHLMNALTWMDSRGAPHVQRLMGGFPSIQGFSVANVLRWLPRTGGAPTLSGKDDIAHMLYVQHELPEVYREADKFLGSKDYLNLRLTGTCAASFDSMTLFWVTDNRDVNRIRYHDGLIRRLGIHREKLPEMRRSTDVLGPVLPAVADALGIRRDTPVVVGSPDLQSACIGSGAVRDYEGHVYIGTSSWVLCHVPFKKTDMFHIIASLPSAIPGRYFCANEQDVAGGCLTFLAKNLLFHRNRLQDREAPEDVYAELDAIAQTVPAGSQRLLFTPWLNGEKSPVDNHSLRGGLHNLSLTTTMDHVIRAVFEGVAYNSRWVLGYVEKFIRRRLDPLNMIGGGAQSDVWCQIYADVLNRTVRRVEDPLQANARGAAFIAAVGLGHIRFEDIPGLIRISRTFEPEPAHRELYDELFAEFVELYKQNRGIYARLNRP